MAKILIVDDEPLIGESLSKAIAGRGHTTVTARNGIEAINALSTGKFDLVLTDIVMPEKDGIELIMELRRHSSGIKIVAMSGGGSTGHVEFLKMAQKLGADAALRKPVRLNELYEVLDTCLGQGS